MDTAIKVVFSALKEYDKNHKREIEELERRIRFLEREKEAIIRNIRDGNFELLKQYFKLE